MAFLLLSRTKKSRYQTNGVVSAKRGADDDVTQARTVVWRDLFRRPSTGWLAHTMDDAARRLPERTEWCPPRPFADNGMVQSWAMEGVSTRV